MNQSNSSSYVGFKNSTSTGGNIYYPIQESLLIMFRNGNIVIPNSTTVIAITESESSYKKEFENVEDLFQFMND